MPTWNHHRAGRVLLVLGFTAAALVVLLLLAAGGFAIWLRNTDLTPLAARTASDALGRPVTIGHLTVTWSDPIGIEISDLAIANADWGSRKDMIRIGRFAALLDAGALWRGQLRYHRLRILDADIVLERDRDGTGNWKFPGASVDSGGSGGGFAIVPKDRTQSPTLIDFAGEQGHITYRTRSGNILDIALDQVAIAAPDETAPVTLRATGAYNGVALDIAAATESFAALRDAARPFGMDFTVTGKDTSLAFHGTSMEPLDFDGMRGALQLQAKTLDDILAAAQAKARVALPLDIAGRFARDGGHWRLTEAKGKLAKTAFAGDLALTEGGRGEADDVALDLDVAPLNLDPLLAAVGAGKGAANADWAKMALYPTFLRDLKLSADLKTPQLSFGGTTLPDFALQGRADGGKVALKALRFGFGGGKLVFSGEADGAGKIPALRLQASLAKADIGAIATLLGGGTEIRGRLDGGAALVLRGATLGDALGRSNGAMLLTLAQGDVARSLIEQVSADLRSIFRDKAGRVEVTCLLAAVTVKNGIGMLAPLRLESPAAILRGAGTIDLRQKRLDLTIQTERDSTNFFALDLPIRVSGPFENLTAKPQLGDDAGVPGESGAGALANLPAVLRQLARGNGCVE